VPAADIPPPTTNRERHLRGLLLAAAGGSLFGLSGTAAQVLFRRYGITPQALVAVRMLGAGALLYAWRRPSFPRRHRMRLVAFSLLAFAAVQYTYFAAIDHSNAATATLLQYLFVPSVAVYEGIAARRMLTTRQVAAVLGALAGTALIVLESPAASVGLTTTGLGVTLGLLAAFTAALNTLWSRWFVVREGAWWTSTWAFIIGGLALSPALASPAPGWPAHPAGGLLEPSYLLVFVVVFGTLFAFGFLMASLAYIPATETAVGATLEPVVAALAALVFLHVVLDGLQYLGGGLIVVSVLALAMDRGRKA
jgi:drug/metabolite transporter (DMT)-like permease